MPDAPEQDRKAPADVLAVMDALRERWPFSDMELEAMARTAIRAAWRAWRAKNVRTL